jgi:hypothetical protein
MEKCELVVSMFVMRREQEEDATMKTSQSAMHQ